MQYSIGIDIGKRKCVACIMDDKKRILEETSYENTSREAGMFARKAKLSYGGKNCQAVCESTGNMWLKTYEAFESAGIPIKLANTYKMRIISDMDVKTDPIDARKLANALRAGMVPECYVAPPELRSVRELMRCRIGLVQDRTAVINQIHSLLDRYDERIDSSHVYSNKGLGQLFALNLGDPNDDAVLGVQARRVRQITEEIADIETRIAAQASVSEDARILMSIPGIDSFTAMLLVSEIGDIARFKTPGKLVAWFGMCPTVHQSGDREYHGKMRKTSNRRCNWAMLQTVRTAAIYDERMGRIHARSKKRNSARPMVARTHVATKMIRIVWSMLVTRTPYSGHDPKTYKLKLARAEAVAAAAATSKMPPEVREKTDK